MLQLCLKTLQKNNWGRTPDKSGVDLARLRFFLKMCQNGFPGVVPERAREPRFSALFSKGSPGEPWVAQMVPKGAKTNPGTAKTNPRGCQNAPPGSPGCSTLLNPVCSTLLCRTFSHITLPPSQATAYIITQNLRTLPSNKIYEPGAVICCMFFSLRASVLSCFELCYKS